MPAGVVIIRYMKLVVNKVFRKLAKKSFSKKFSWRKNENWKVYILFETITDIFTLRLQHIDAFMLIEDCKNPHFENPNHVNV